MGLFRKLFLIREIISRKGVVHFQRYRLLETKWLRLYIHHILESDKDGDLHDHPWNLISVILKGHYVERRPDDLLTDCKPGVVFHRRADQPHCIDEVVKPTWTFVIAYGKRRLWGYHTAMGWVDHETYQSVKNRARKISEGLQK